MTTKLILRIPKKNTLRFHDMKFRIALLLLICIEIPSVLGQINDSIRLNDIRILASHNSYKKKPDPRLLSFITKHKEKFGPENDPIQLDYEHQPLSIQLDSFNVRGFELDVYADPKGGRYKKRAVNGFVKGMHKNSNEPDLKTPGFKIIHISDVDYQTNYLTFKSALKELNEWSKSHPGHIPLFVNIEAKGMGLGDESGILNFIGFKKAIRFDSTIYSLLNNEIEESIDSLRLYRPKHLAGKYKTIKERLESEGWPKLNDCLGKIIFILEGDQQEIYQHRLENGEQLPMFVYGNPDDEMTAFVKRNNPVEHEEEIDDLTAKYIVRTRSDAGTIEARKNDYTRFNAALASNAQIISTDYYKADLSLSTFCVKLASLYLLRR